MSSTLSPFGSTIWEENNCSTNEQMNVTGIDKNFRILFQSITSTFGLINFYLLMALTAYEIFHSKKAKGGRKLRVLCILTVFTSVCYEALLQIIAELSGKSQQLCLILMITRTTVQNMTFSLTYAFMWQRQLTVYRSKKFEDLRGTKMKIVTWVVLALIIVNPIIMFGIQFQDGLYKVENGVCLVLKLCINELIPFLFVAFSYSFIQVALVFLFFFPLYKRKSIQRFQNRSRQNQKSSKKSCSRTERLQSIITRTYRRSEGGEETSFERTSSNAPNKSVKKRSLDQRLSQWCKLSLVCITSDFISASVIAIFILVQTPSPFVTPLMLWWDISTLVSTVCLIGYFKNFKTMLFPFPKLIRYHYKKRYLKNQNNISMNK